MKQNSSAWLEWRRKGLGASDASIIMGVSPYKTRRQLWENKLKLRPDDQESFITELGHQFEPKARARFALETGIDLKADICLEHPEFKYLRASLDGHCEQSRTFAEIKMVGKKKMEWLKENKRPLDEHVPQVQQQFLVSRYERGYYIAYCLNESKTEISDYVAFQVSPDGAYMRTLFIELQAFWNLVISQTPPELEKRDEYEFKADEIIKIANYYKTVKTRHDKLTAELDDLSAQLKAVASQHSRVRMGDVVIVSGTRKGAVDYDKVPELKNVDLEQYRKAPIKTQSISIKAAK